ncbi:hypothetical protein A3A66_00760 [Microgenomates group bacterium RIFCSPLOWO2_01_FULL_46_13]|nr:MAG: hypothetical protein A2783_02835 [Microgenomates group bacterium RIFCSPHIGHO2_01_FULL_45_11]OGV94538.1 MAG: hypothetical protein A3A66_00760 [Microgenomates group bacterium RIFCSPLOWO2_01_FULL_46_13]
MNLCITGALGHIGSSLIRNLPKKTFERIYLVDNLLTQRYASLFDLPSGFNFRFRPLSILDDQVEKIIKVSDIIVHLAAVTDAETSFSKRAEVNTVNKKGLNHVARLCSHYHRALIFPSTTSVYGVQKGVVDETCEEKDLQPQSPYAESKLYGEKFLSTLARSSNLPFTILRFGTIVGYSTGMRFHTAANKFIWQAVFNQPITVWKTALHQQRPYCALDDCVRAINWIITKKIFAGDIYNIITANLTVSDILKTIQLYIPTIKVQFVDSPIMNQLSYTVSNSRSRQLGFRYHGNIPAAIQETVQKLRKAYAL